MDEGGLVDVLAHEERAGAVGDGAFTLTTSYRIPETPRFGLASPWPGCLDSLTSTRRANSLGRMETAHTTSSIAEQTQRRIDQLRGEWIDEDTLRAIYGLPLDDEDFTVDFRRWGRLLRRPREVRRNGSVNRTALENYFSQRKVLPRRWSAARLGMTQPSLERALETLEEKGLLQLGLSQGPTLTAALDQVLVQTLPALQGRVFGNHSDFCRRLHQALRAFGVEIEEMYCHTDRLLHPDNTDNTDYSSEYCMITDAPVGLRFRVWLDFGKPMNLAPDTCSTRAYFEPDRAPLLEAYVMGSRPERPRGL